MTGADPLMLTLLIRIAAVKVGTYKHIGRTSEGDPFTYRLRAILIFP